VSGQVHAPAALPHAKSRIGQENGWAPEPDWTQW